MPWYAISVLTLFFFNVGRVEFIREGWCFEFVKSASWANLEPTLEPVNTSSLSNDLLWILVYLLSIQIDIKQMIINSKCTYCANRFLSVRFILEEFKLFNDFWALLHCRKSDFARTGSRILIITVDIFIHLFAGIGSVGYSFARVQVHTGTFLFRRCGSN